MTMDDRVAASLAGPRSYAVFLAGFSLCALVIAGVGLFGVLSYMTSQRTREIGLRTALGARRGDVLALVAQQALTITARAWPSACRGVLPLAVAVDAALRHLDARRDQLRGRAARADRRVDYGMCRARLARDADRSAGRIADGMSEPAKVRRSKSRNQQVSQKSTILGLTSNFDL